MNKPPATNDNESASDDPSGGQKSPVKLNELQVAEKPDANQLVQFVTTIKNAEQQVGENILSAMQHEGTVAVLTTAAMGPNGQQHVLSIALDANRLTQVQEILQTGVKEKEDEEPCVGFHCLVKPKKSTK